MNDTFAFGLTGREVLLIFISPLILWAAKTFAKGWWETMRTSFFRSWGSGIRFVMLAVSFPLALGLSGQEELSPRQTLFMIICCLVSYWAVMTQREKNAQEAINGQKNRATKQDEEQVTRNAEAIDHENENRKGRE